MCVCGVQKVVAVPVSTPPATALIFISQKDAVWCESVGLKWAYSEQEIFMIPRAMNQVFLCHKQSFVDELVLFNINSPGKLCPPLFLRFNIICDLN